MAKKTKQFQHKPLLLHLTRNFIFALLVIVAALFAGMLGYHYFEKMPWDDAFLNAAMILSGMGPVTVLTTTKSKIFAGCYALFSGLAFIAIIALVFAPILHRFFRKIHLDEDKEDK